MNDTKIRTVAGTATLLLILFLSPSYSQVTFEQKQNVIVNSSTGSLIQLKNNNSSSFSDISFQNDAGPIFSLGIAGSTNTFFAGQNSTPFLFNSSGQDFHFRSGTLEKYKFFLGSSNIANITNQGLEVALGNSLSLESLNGSELTAMRTEDDGSFAIYRNGLGGSFGLLMRDSYGIGLNTNTVKGDLHVEQESKPVASIIGNSVSDSSGLRLNSWNLYNNSIDNLCFVFNGVLKSYVHSTTGDFISASDRRLKEDIAYLEPSLEKIKQLKPARYNYIDGDKSTMGFIAQEVEPIYPDIVFDNGDYKAIAYDKFAVLSIKGIQELLVKVERQDERLLTLEAENRLLKESIKSQGQLIEQIQKQMVTERE